MNYAKQFCHLIEKVCLDKLIQAPKSVASKGVQLLFEGVTVAQQCHLSKTLDYRSLENQSQSIRDMVILARNLLGLEEAYQGANRLIHENSHVCPVVPLGYPKNCHPRRHYWSWMEGINAITTDESMMGDEKQGDSPSGNSSECCIHGVPKPSGSKVFIY